MSDAVRPPVATSVALFAGAIAGASVDTSLYPIDTIKTRLQVRSAHHKSPLRSAIVVQSKAGFWKAGGFTGVYRGLSSAIIGSAPGAALFFGGYEGAQKLLKNSGMGDTPLMYAMASSMGEVVSARTNHPGGIGVYSAAVAPLAIAVLSAAIVPVLPLYLSQFSTRLTAH